MDDFSPQAADAFHWRLLEAYFSENRTISDPEVLGQLAAEIGEDTDRFLDAVQGQWQQAAGKVIDEHNEAWEKGITAVPTVLVGGVLPIAGAQEVDSYITWIDRLLAKRSH